MTGSSLQCIDFVRLDGTPSQGLISVGSADVSQLNVDEQAAVFDANLLQHIDYIFFRRFSDGRSSQVAAYIVDNSDERLDEKDLAALHLQVWLHGTAPLLYIAWPSRIDVLACARGPDFWRDQIGQYDYNPAQILEIASGIDHELKTCSQYSAFRLADGTFWENPRNSGLADHAKTAHQLLIQAIVEADSDIDGENNPTLRRLLLLMVLIKYLEDRRVFPNHGWFGKYHKGARTFFEVLKGNDPEEVYRLLDSLERRFNGDVFSLPREGREKLTRKALKRFADLVEARTVKRQRYLWEQFSFEHLPVEMISHLYQRFVQGGHGTVYTPPFLASLLLDQAMPYEKLTGEERVLDPACGSGVFLVGAFRRLINIWRSRHRWKRPDVSSLKRLLKQSIYGIELDPNAVDLASFSLSLAICDALKPEVIWSELRFDPLRNTNLLEADFFELLNRSRKGESTLFDQGFDIVVGNPPFESELSPAGDELNQAAQQQDPHHRSLPDKQTAYLFLEQGLSVLKPDGRACLIQPSGLLYNRQASDFRTAILQKHQVDTVLDFTSIRNLYDKADPKTIAVLAHADTPHKDHWIKHWTFRRTTTVHECICFELDHYDRHRVHQQQAETDSYVWRANLLGGGRLNDIARRFLDMRTLEAYVKEMGWDYGEGFIVGSRTKCAPFLTGKKYLPTSALSNTGIDVDKIRTLTETHFLRPRREEIFTTPLILIKETDFLPFSFWDKGFLTYRDQIVGIHAPQSQATALRNLYEIFRQKHDLYRFACTLNGSKSLVGKATAISKQDIDLLPYPENKTDLDLSFWEEALRKDVLNYMTDYVRLGQNSKLLKKAADKDTLQEYSKIFIRMLGSIYDNLQAVDPIFLNGLICQPFCFGDHPNLSWLHDNAQDELQKLIYDDNYEHLRTVRVLRLYSENVLLLIKPDRLRYWIRSTAIRDADETLVDLRRQGY